MSKPPSILKLTIVSILFCTINGFMSNDTKCSNIRPMTTLFVSSPSTSNSVLGRRAALELTGSALTISSIFSFADVAQAKEKDKEPATLETVKQSFQSVRDELNSGGISQLASLVEREEYEKIMDFTKEYDLDFRKAKMGKARKFLTSKEDKEKAVLLCNAVTFDLIGMNKGSRVGQQNIEQVKKYYSELKEDVQSFLDLEQNIDVTAYITQ